MRKIKWYEEIRVRYASGRVIVHRRACLSVRSYGYRIKCDNDDLALIPFSQVEAVDFYGSYYP